VRISGDREHGFQTIVSSYFAGSKTPIPHFISVAALAWPLTAQGQPAPFAASPSSDPASIAKFGPLPGRWMRMDGGYVITIKAVDVNGKLDASCEPMISGGLATVLAQPGNFWASGHPQMTLRWSLCMPWPAEYGRREPR
jgi:hypothetical protein